MNVSCIFTILCLLIGIKSQESIYPYPFRDPSLPLNERIDDLVQRLTLQEIVNQTYDYYPNPVLGIPRLGIKPYVWNTECLHGEINSNATAFPQSIGIASSFSDSVMYKMAEISAIEMRAFWNAFSKLGIYQMYYGLSCFGLENNILRHPLWGRNQETYGEDPYVTGRMVQAFMKGLHGPHERYQRATSGCKALSVYSGPESSRFSFDAKATERDLRMTYFPAFKMCVEGNVNSIMCSYSSLNGVPSCANKMLLTDVLRKEWGFDGYVVADDAALNFMISDHHYVKNDMEALLVSFKNGVNMDFGDERWSGPLVFWQQLPALEQGKITEDDIRNNVKPILKARFLLGEFDPEDMNPYNKIGMDVVQSAAHREAAIEAAMMGFVLLKNTDNTLPLTSIAKRVAIIGPMANDSGQLFGDYSPSVTQEFTVTPYEGLKALGSTSILATGCADGTSCNTYNSTEIGDAVKSSDLVIVCLGTGTNIESEGTDRSSLDLPGKQLVLLQDAVKYANGAPVILVLYNAGPLDISWAKYSADVHAIVECFFPAQSAGVALFRLLTASSGPPSVPAARLPNTWPASLSHVPHITDYSMDNNTYRYSRAVPLYPFGYGLSYSRFVYSDLHVLTPTVKAGDAVTVSAGVQNLGPYDADEVVQVYIAWPYAAVPVPKLQLVAFTRISLAVFEKHRLEFTITGEQLAVWVDDVGFRVLPGEMHVFYGGQQPNQPTSAPSNVLRGAFAIV